MGKLSSAERDILIKLINSYIKVLKGVISSESAIKVDGSLREQYTIEIKKLSDCRITIDVLHKAR